MDKDIYHTIYLNRWVSSRFATSKPLPGCGAARRRISLYRVERFRSWFEVVSHGCWDKESRQEAANIQFIKRQSCEGHLPTPWDYDTLIQSCFLELHHLKTTGSWNKTGNLNIVWTSSIHESWRRKLGSFVSDNPQQHSTEAPPRVVCTLQRTQTAPQLRCGGVEVVVLLGKDHIHLQGLTH